MEDRVNRMRDLLKYQAMQAADTLRWLYHSPNVGKSDPGDFVIRGDGVVGKGPQERIALGRQWLFKGQKYLTEYPDMWKDAIIGGSGNSVRIHADTLYYGPAPPPTPPPPPAPPPAEPPTEDGIDKRLLVGGVIAGAVILYAIYKLKGD